MYKQVLYQIQYLGLNDDKTDDNDINKFIEYMNQDFNVQNVLTLINDVVKEINTSLRSKNYDIMLMKFNTFKQIFEVLGINLFINPMNDEQLDIYKKWNEAKLNKNFELADELRGKLQEWKLI